MHIIESQNYLVWKWLSKTFSSNPSCSKPPPTWPWTLLMMEHSQFLQPICLTSPTVKKVFLISEINLPFSKFKTIAPCQITTGPSNKSFAVFLISPFYILKGHNKATVESSLLQVWCILQEPSFYNITLQWVINPEAFIWNVFAGFGDYTRFAMKQELWIDGTDTIQDNIR